MQNSLFNKAAGRVTTHAVNDSRRKTWPVDVYVQFLLNLFGLGFLRCLGLVVIGGGGGGGSAAAYNSKSINDIEMKFGWVVKNNKAISLIRFNLQKSRETFQKNNK